MADWTARKVAGGRVPGKHGKNSIKRALKQHSIRDKSRFGRVSDQNALEASGVHMAVDLAGSIKDLPQSTEVSAKTSPNLNGGKLDSETRVTAEGKALAWPTPKEALVTFSNPPMEEVDSVREVTATDDLRCKNDERAKGLRPESPSRRGSRSTSSGVSDLDAMRRNQGYPSEEELVVCSVDSDASVVPETPPHYLQSVGHARRVSWADEVEATGTKNAEPPP